MLPLGRGGGQVVSVLAFYSDYPISNPAELYIFFCKFVFEKNENKQKEARVSHLNTFMDSKSWSHNVVSVSKFLYNLFMLIAFYFQAFPLFNVHPFLWSIMHFLS